MDGHPSDRRKRRRGQNPAYRPTHLPQSRSASLRAPDLGLFGIAFLQSPPDFILVDLCLWRASVGAKTSASSSTTRSCHGRPHLARWSAWPAGEGQPWPPNGSPDRSSPKSDGRLVDVVQPLGCLEL